MPAVIRMDKKTGAADISVAGQAWKPIAEAGPDAYAALATPAPQNYEILADPAP